MWVAGCCYGSLSPAFSLPVRLIAVSATAPTPTRGLLFVLQQTSLYQGPVVKAAPKLLARPAAAAHARLQDEAEEEEAEAEEEAAPEEAEAEAEEAAPADAEAEPAETPAAPAAADGGVTGAAEGAAGGVMDTMSEFTPHLDKIHWPQK